MRKEEISGFIKGKAVYIVPAAFFQAVTIGCLMHTGGQAPVITTRAISVSYRSQLKDSEVADRIRVEDKNGRKRSNVDVTIDHEKVDTGRIGTYETTARAETPMGSVSKSPLTVRVVDDEPPVISVKDEKDGHVAVPLNGDGNPLSYISASDNADGSMSVETEGSIDASKAGSYEVTASATDGSGNGTTRTVVFDVADRTKPVIEQTKKTADYREGASLGDFFRATDDSGSAELKADHEIDTSKEGVQKIHVTATDPSGNTAEGDYEIEVKDISAPDLQLTADRVSVDKGAKLDPKSLIRSAADKRDGDLANLVAVDGLADTSKPGSYTVTYSVSDKAGNRAEKKAVIVVKETEKVEPSGWSGSRLTKSAGVNNGPSGKETYYNLPMGGVVRAMQRRGYDLNYWVRDDGVKMYGKYVMVAANLDIRPYGTIVPTSLGEGMVVDTGTFASSNPRQLDIAVSW